MSDSIKRVEDLLGMEDSDKIMELIRDPHMKQKLREYLQTAHLFREDQDLWKLDAKSLLEMLKSEKTVHQLLKEVDRNKIKSLEIKIK